ncbi:PEP-CTERM sorting domain-containing protein [Microcystis sp.]|uniref:PEP-CTERM sorting domain-containing protein n=1 Tax=Microcystis sp. TaxID=1127 RepID=UPI00391D462D
MSNNRIVRKTIKSGCCAVAAFAFASFLLPIRPASAVIVTGVTGNPVPTFASLVAYRICVRKNRPNCGVLLILDPPGNNVSQIGFTMKYDTNKIKIGPDPSAFFFCDFSDGGVCPPIETQTGVAELLEGDFPLQGPRPGTVFTFTNNEDTGTLTLDYNLTANPADGTGDRNFFGFDLDVLTSFNAVEYFEQPGNYDIYFERFSCTANGIADSCGSSNPVAGINFIKVPEPSSILSILALGTLGAASTLKRQLKSSKSSEKETAKVS